MKLNLEGCELHTTLLDHKHDNVYTLITVVLSRKVQRNEKINEIGRNLDEYVPRVKKTLDLDSCVRNHMQ
jgi:hypothetical protein